MKINHTDMTFAERKASRKAGGQKKFSHGNLSWTFDMHHAPAQSFQVQKGEMLDGIYQLRWNTREEVNAMQKDLNKHGKLYVWQR